MKSNLGNCCFACRRFVKLSLLHLSAARKLLSTARAPWEPSATTRHIRARWRVLTSSRFWRFRGEERAADSPRFRQRHPAANRRDIGKDDAWPILTR